LFLIDGLVHSGSNLPLVDRHVLASGDKPSGRIMKMVAEYLEHALQFERLAAAEKDSKLKSDFEKQAKAYRKLAGERAKQLGLPEPPNAE
jgi:hypothetical protein